MILHQCHLKGLGTRERTSTPRVRKEGGSSASWGREVEMGLDGRSQGGAAATVTVESELACDGCGLVGNENGNSTGHGGEEGSFPDIRPFEGPASFGFSWKPGGST